MKARISMMLSVMLLIAAACGVSSESDVVDDSSVVDSSSESTTSGDGQASQEDSTAPATAEFSVGLALAGPRNDRGFYQNHFEGVDEAAAEHGFEFSVVDGLEDPQRRIDALRNLAEDNELVLGGGAAFADAGNAIAGQFPETVFVVTSGVTDPDIPNLHSYVAQQGAPAYLAGLAAVETTKANKIGFIGGAEIPPTFLSDQFFEAAVKELSPDVEYVSTVIGTFNDAALAKEAASAQIAAGVDVIFAFLDAGIPGVLQAGQEAEQEIKVINPITNRCEESEELLGYTFLNANLLVKIVVEDYMDEALPGGTEFYALQNTDIQDFRLCSAYEGGLQMQVDELRSELQSGERQLPEPE